MKINKTCNDFMNAQDRRKPMNIISCDGCAVILNKDKLKFPNREDYYSDENGWDETKCAWNGYDYTPFVECPICEHKIPEEGEIY